MSIGMCVKQQLLEWLTNSSSRRWPLAAWAFLPRILELEQQQHQQVALKIQVPISRLQSRKLLLQLNKHQRRRPEVVVPAGANSNWAAEAGAFPSYLSLFVYLSLCVCVCVTAMATGRPSSQVNPSFMARASHLCTSNRLAWSKFHVVSCLGPARLVLSYSQNLLPSYTGQLPPI